MSAVTFAICSLFWVDIFFNGVATRAIHRIGSYCDNIITNEINLHYQNRRIRNGINDDGTSVNETTTTTYIDVPPAPDYVPQSFITFK